MWIIILSTLAMLLASISAIINILRLCNVGTFVSFNHTLDIIATTAMFVVALLLVLFVASSGYTIGKKALIFNLGFFVTKMNYSDIVLVRENVEKTLMFVYYKVDKNPMVVNEERNIKANFVQIKTNEKHFDTIFDGIKKNNKNVVFELFEQDKNNKEKEVK